MVTKSVREMNLLIALFLIVFEAIPEALSDKGKKAIAGVMEFIYLAFVTICVFAVFNGYTLPQKDSNPYYIIGGYVLLRFALFDVIYSLIRGTELFYIGKTKLSDKAWNWFFKKTRIPSGHFLAMVKFISLLISVTWLVK